MKTVTNLFALLVALGLTGPAALVAQELGDEFILFADGTNILIPTADAQAVLDPVDPGSGNRVARINTGDWVHAGFAWERTEGIDATANVGEVYGESDTLFFKILSDPANADEPALSIMLTDKTDDSGANDGTADNEFRLIWPIPAWIHDGEWHDLAIPLPPATHAALEDAKASGTMDTLAAKWEYPGSWSIGGFGIGPGFGTSTEDPLWREFEWDALYRVGPFWDNNVNPGGPIYLDDVYIGGPGTDISQATEPPSAMSGVSFEPDGPENLISWTPNAEFAGYNIYASETPISDVAAEGVILLTRVSFDEGSEFRHRYELPHPSFGSQPLYYAVTSLSGFGVENFDVSASAGEIINADLSQKAYIRELTEDQANALFLDLSSQTATDEGFPDDQPIFYLDSSHRSPGDGTSEATVPEDEDNSAWFKIGYTNLNELFIYGEVVDQEVTFAPVTVTGADTWNYDSAEIVFGNYDVRNTEGGGVLVGSPHQDMQRGAEPDYGIRVAGQQDGGELAQRSTWVGWSLDVDFESASAIEVTDTGWKFLTLLNLDQIQADGDEFLPVPASDELQIIPFIISLNDADGATRETQIVWSIKPNVTTQWWNTPAQWEAVAVAGLDYVASAVEDRPEIASDEVMLAQNSPNPVSGMANIEFTLAAPQHATVEVFNMLGQRVETVADGNFTAGVHRVKFDTSPLAAGVYVYRLATGDQSVVQRTMVVK